VVLVGLVIKPGLLLLVGLVKLLDLLGLVKSLDLALLGGLVKPDFVLVLEADGVAVVAAVVVDGVTLATVDFLW